MHFVNFYQSKRSHTCKGFGYVEGFTHSKRSFIFNINCKSFCNALEITEKLGEPFVKEKAVFWQHCKLWIVAVECTQHHRLLYLSNTASIVKYSRMFCWGGVAEFLTIQKLIFKYVDIGILNIHIKKEILLLWKCYEILI